MERKQEILAEVLKNAAAFMLAGNTNIEVEAKDDDGNVFFITELRQMANWGYTQEEWGNMDFYLLAGETLQAQK